MNKAKVVPLNKVIKEGLRTKFIIPESTKIDSEVVIKVVIKIK